MRTIAIALLAVAAACAPGGPADDDADRPGGRTAAGTSGSGPEETALRLTLERAHALADSIEETLRPVPLMRPADEANLRRYGQSVQLPRAQALGVRARDEAELEALTRSGRLVPLEDSTRFWVLRDLRSSRPLVTPDTRVLLERLAEAFQARLAGMGIPPYRLEITSVLRSAADQADLRRSNVNAAAGVSTHEYGTTVDIAYSAYAPPQELPEGLVAAGDAPPWMAPYLDGLARPVLESVSARKSRELKAILGEVLREAQSDGLVLVTLERLQPVYHITVARRLAEGEGG